MQDSPIDPDFLSILVCPETHQPVALADAATLDRVNAAVGAGRALTRAGEVVGEAVTHGLVREDGSVLYPIRDGIPIMLIDDSIGLEKL